jgi:signal transduction histidine kinase/ActR/RegA family two-component response regulator
MRVTLAAVAVPILLVLLTWLSFRAIDTDAERYDRALKALDRFTMMEIALHRDVLSARAGMLRNYDPLVREVNALRESLGLLRGHASGDPEEAAAIDRFAASANRQEELTEQFKSDNALLQNSLAHFRLFSARLSASDGSAALAPTVSALAAAMLQLTLDTSPAAAREVVDRLNDLAAQPFSSGDANSVQPLLAHGRLLYDLLPKTDGMLRKLLAAPSNPELKTLRTMVLTRQAASRATSREFRLVLYAASLLLLGILVHLGLRLRERALTLQRRAAFEHVIAGISTRLIDAQPYEIEAHISRALAELAELVDADRAYLMVSGNLHRIHCWCRQGITFPPGWPDRVPALAARFAATAEGIIHVQSVDRLPPGSDKEVLAAVGLHSWACISSLTECGLSTKVIGFDALRPGMITQSAELGLLRMALDAVANVVIRDHLLRERVRLETNLQQARRMETVGALASGIAHNFNNIVGAILGHAEMAEAQFASDSQPVRSLKEIRRAGERARDLIDQILAFGRRTDVQRRPVSMRGLVAETSSLLHVSLPSRIELAVRAVPEAAVISGQPGQLQQVLLNLCNNAAQAMDQGGRVEIETEVHQITRPRSLAHGDLRPGRYVRTAVSDTGRGIDEATLQRIFETFFTTRLAGNGLGLATVREIVREHGGAMDVWSLPGVGSRFEVWLPCITTAAPPPRDEVSTLRLGSGQTVLVVEAASERLLADEEMLAALGYEPVGFTRAADALAACRAMPKRFDALLVGHVSSTGSALDLAAALHESVPDVPVLLATGWAEEIGVDALVAAGIAEVVHRPLVSAEMASALARSLRVSEISVSELRP